MRNSLTFKLFVIGFLILLLMIPIVMIQSIIRERQMLRDEATAEVSSKWGNAQVIGGPVISIPFKVTEKSKDDETEKKTINYAHFLPDQLLVNGDVNTEKRKRGIYTVVLYNTKLRIKGSFSSLDIAKLGIDVSKLEFQNAFVSIGITDLKGIRDKVVFNANNTAYNLDPGIPIRDVFSSGVSLPIKIANATDKLDFQATLDLNGSSSIYFLPFGKETSVSLNAKWSSPSFEGSFLPDNRTVDGNGFKANWKVLHLNRNYPQQGINSFIGNENHLEVKNDYLSGYHYQQNNQTTAGKFGVRLMLPVDEYQKTTRSAKYSVMFVVLTFLVIFFSEILRGVRVHAIQYLLVGFAVCLFYLLLLSFSEHVSFNWAYLLACSAILGLVAFYVHAIFQNKYATSIITITLAILYGFFYTLLQLEEYALLLGSLGLLLILSGVMYLTRNIDWYNVRKQQ